MISSRYALDGTVASSADRDLLDLSAPVAETHHALGAGLGPSHRASQTHRHPGHEQLLGIAEYLRAEAATHVGSDHTNLLRLDLEHLREQLSRCERVLTRDPEGEAPVLLDAGGGGADLQRAGGQALVDSPLGHHHLAAVEQGLVAAERQLQRDVAAGRLEQQRLRRGRLLGVHHDRQRLVVHLDEISPVACLGLGLRHNRGDRFAHEPDHAVGKQRARHRRVQHRQLHWERWQLEVRCGEHVENPRRSKGGGSVDPCDPGVGIRRAYVGHPRSARDLQVVNVGPAHCQEFGVLFAQDRGCQGCSRVSPSVGTRAQANQSPSPQPVVVT